MTRRVTGKMNMRKGSPTFVLLMICMSCVSGSAPRPEELQVNILDGEVVALWKHHEAFPSDIKYNVEMGKYTGEWNMVASCTGIPGNYCVLTGLIDNYRVGYKVKVQLVKGDDKSEWTMKKFLPSTSELLPPSFTLWATSSTLTVDVHQKPILKKLFPFGTIYTIYLKERGDNSKNTTAILTDNFGEDQRTKTFSSLHWGKEYCVSVKVEGKGALSASHVSNTKCVQLPEHEWFIIAVSSLTILAVLVVTALMTVILLCYLRGPEKTPAALKSPVSGWRPLSVGEGTMEVVTDKGWFLSSRRTEVKTNVKDLVTHVTVTEDNEEEDRRTSMDSGVSMEPNSATNSEGGSPTLRQEDSGCGSLGGPGSSTSSQTVYPLQEEMSDMDLARKREDSGVGLGCQLHSSSVNLDGQDSGSLTDVVVGGDYRSQGPSSVQMHACKDEDMFKDPDSVLAEVVTGYRAMPQSCICSGAGQCTWCLKQNLFIKQYKPLFIDNGLLIGKGDFVDSYKGITLSSYCKKAEMDTVMGDSQTTFIELGETFPLLTALTPLPLVEGGQDFNMNNVSLSLCDVELTTD